MAPTPSIDRLIREHYPDAVTEVVFFERIWQVLEENQHIDLSKVLLANSLCADDVIPVRESDIPSIKTQGKLKRHFLGPFSMGGMAGIPYSGLTGLSTVAHHIPDGGSVLIAYGPHIGITDRGDLGMLLRPGQHRESAACGALTLAIEHFRSSPAYQPPCNDDDTEQMTLERRLLPFRPQILSAEKPLLAATEIAYTIIHELIHRYVRTQISEFSCEYVAFAGGIVINTNPFSEDYVDPRHLSVVRVSELS